MRVLQAPSNEEFELIRRAAAGARLAEPELDLMFDVFAVSTEAQLTALARARGWLDAHGDPPITPAQREYLRQFDSLLRSRTDAEFDYARQGMTRALEKMRRDAGVYQRDQ